MKIVTKIHGVQRLKKALICGISFVEKENSSGSTLNYLCIFQTGHRPGQDGNKKKVFARK
jgi:hypothetical protein